jgi:hypothetical protein
MTEQENLLAQKVEQQCREQLAAHVAAIDPVIRSRLSAGRRRALEALSAEVVRREFRVPGAWLPVGVAAFAAALAVTVWVARPTPVVGPTVADATAVEDVELLASGEETEFYSEDPVFYEWAGAPQSGAG